MSPCPGPGAHFVLGVLAAWSGNGIGPDLSSCQPQGAGKDGPTASHSHAEKYLLKSGLPLRPPGRNNVMRILRLSHHPWDLGRDMCFSPVPWFYSWRHLNSCGCGDGGSLSQGHGKPGESAAPLPVNPSTGRAGCLLPQTRTTTLLFSYGSSETHLGGNSQQPSWFSILVATASGIPEALITASWMSVVLPACVLTSLSG